MQLRGEPYAPASATRQQDGEALPHGRIPEAVIALAIPSEGAFVFHLTALDQGAGTDAGGLESQAWPAPGAERCGTPAEGRAAEINVWRQGCIEAHPLRAGFANANAEVGGHWNPFVPEPLEGCSAGRHPQPLRIYQLPVFGIDAHGSAGGSGSPRCSSSIEI